MTSKRKQSFCNTKYLATTAILTSLLFVLALLTSFINLGSSTFQISDGLFLILIPLIPGPMMLICGVIYAILFDLITGGLIFIPCSFLIHLMMYLFIKLFVKWIPSYLLLFLANLIIFLYVPYNYLVNLNLGLKIAQAAVWRELVVDSIQVMISFIISLVLTYVFQRYRFNIYLKEKFFEMTRV